MLRNNVGGFDRAVLPGSEWSLLIAGGVLDPDPYLRVGSPRQRRDHARCRVGPNELAKEAISMSEHQSDQQPPNPGSDDGRESVATFPFGAAMSACCGGQAMNRMAAFCRPESEESEPSTPGEDQVLGP